VCNVVSHIGPMGAMGLIGAIDSPLTTHQIDTPAPSVYARWIAFLCRGRPGRRGTHHAPRQTRADTPGPRVGDCRWTGRPAGPRRGERRRAARKTGHGSVPERP